VSSAGPDARARAEQAVEEALTGKRRQTPGEQWEGMAFTFCKAATLVLLFQLVLGPRFVLPAVCLGTALLYVTAFSQGCTATRCLLRHPLLIVGFYAGVAALALWLSFAGITFPSLIH
jgi:hypothetical protein